MYSTFLTTVKPTSANMLTYNFNDCFNQVVKLNTTSSLIEVEYRIQKYSRVTLQVIDSFGKKILTVVDAYQEAGLHNWKINTSKIKKGIYSFKTIITTSNEEQICYLNQYIEISSPLTIENKLNTINKHFAIT